MTQSKRAELPECCPSLHRVLIVSDAAPHRNGVGAYYADLIEQLQRSVERTELLSPTVSEGEWKGGWSIPMPGDTTQRLILPNWLTIEKKIEAFKPTVIIVPTPGPFGLIAAIAAKRHNVTLVVGFHTWFEKLSHLYWGRVQGNLTQAYFEYSHKLLFKLADHVFANSTEMIEIARQQGADDAQLMGTPVAQRFITESLMKAPAKLGTYLFVGRLAAEKNLSQIVDAAREHPQLSFTIAGDGPEKLWLLEQVKGLPNVHYLGWVGREQLHCVMDQHDALILPSSVESFGTVALEAMARQRFVIVSQQCGISEWEQFQPGLSVMNANETLSAALSRLTALSEFEVYSQAMMARRLCVQHLGWNEQQWMAAFNKKKANASAHTGQDTLQKIKQWLSRGVS